MSLQLPINQKILQQAAAIADESVWEKFPNLGSWINEDRGPTLNQLAAFSETVHIPFGYFFLDKLPEEQKSLPLFRSGQKKPVYTLSNNLQETIDEIERRQSWLSYYLQSEGNEFLNFIGSVNNQTNIKEIAASIREELKINKDWAKLLPGKDEAFKFLVEKIEAAGIFVTINGVIGNGHTRLDRNEFKGFALVDDFAPFIFINGQDYDAAKLFTLLHETAHLWFGRSAAISMKNLMPASDETEKSCDAIAAEILVPQELILKNWPIAKKEKNPRQFLSRQFKVSEIVIARRLFDLQIYTRADFFQYYRQYNDHWNKKKEDKDTGGGSFYLNQNNRVGKTFFKKIIQAVDQGKLLYSEAYKLTNLYGDTFQTYKNRLKL